nr:hypothetical protein [Desulfobacterales bacterium]
MDKRGIRTIDDLNLEELRKLVRVYAKNWIAHDGCWFLALEEAYDIKTAIDLDCKSWERFTVVEANRVMEFLGLKPGGGINTLAQALNFRLYAAVNLQEIEIVDENTLVFKMRNCRVQSARKRKNLADFPCKPVGIVEYSGFAKTIDPKIETRCIACPPDDHPEDFWCAWEFKYRPNSTT